MLGGMPAPDLEGAAAVTAPPLAEATVAIVTTAGLRPADKAALWQPGDVSFVPLAKDMRNMHLNHMSPNFDRAGFAQDLNVVFPIDRLEEMAEAGVIGAVADTNYSFMGAQMELATLIQDTGPAAAQELLDAGVDVVLLTPV